jgi:hypothetical protein
MLKGAGFEEVLLSPLVFGGASSYVELDAGSRAGFRWTRLCTAAGFARLGAVAMTLASALITAAFGIGKFQAWVHVTHAAAGVWLLAAAVLAAGALGLGWLAGDWFKDDVP